jgi:triosephosphate isomerase
MITPQETTIGLPPPPTSFLPGSQSSWAPGGAAAQQAGNEQHISLLPKLEAMGVTWSMAGFAEERSLHEAAAADSSSSSTINAHVLRLIANGKSVVLSLRETMEDFQQDRMGPIFEAQLKKELAGVSADGLRNKVTIVYEPIWAVVASTEDDGATSEEERPQESPALAQATLDVCRHVLAILYSHEVANATRILYGGAAIGEHESIDAFMDMPDIDGALVDVPSSVEDFKRIVNFQAPRKGGGLFKTLWSRVTKGSS